MPSMKMKSKLRKDLLRATDGHICKKKNIQCSQSKFSFADAELDKCNHNCLCDSLGTELHAQDIGTNEVIDILGEQDSQFLKHLLELDNSVGPGRQESDHNFMFDPEMMFSPILETDIEYSEPNIEVDQGCTSLLPSFGVDGTIHNRDSYGEQACDISDFSIDAMIILGVPIDENRGNCGIPEMDILPSHICNEQRTSFDAAEQCVALPSLEDKSSHKDELRSRESDLGDRDSYSLCPIEQMTPFYQKADFISGPWDSGYFDLQFLKHMPEPFNVVSDFLPAMLHKDDRKRKAVTLVLDLDETLVHSTMHHWNNADFAFTVFIDSKEHTVYVKQRPHLFAFLERVAEMFEVVIFTASQSFYAAKLLDILDPDGKLISRRLYRESCIVSDGSYTKDLTVLGVDLAKVVIVDNSPQVFRLQVNNGIPIKSWFDDPSDNALISLLPFLETLVDADDVRPIIANAFGNKEHV